MSNYNKWMQYFWLSVAIISGVYALISFTNRHEEPVEILVYFMPFLALTLFFIRKWHNKRMDKMKNESQTQNDKVDQ